MIEVKVYKLLNFEYEEDFITSIFLEWEELAFYDIAWLWRIIK